MTPSTNLALVDYILPVDLHVELARSPAVVGFHRERKVWSPHSRLKVR
jgi:hypothetical protein